MPVMTRVEGEAGRPGASRQGTAVRTRTPVIACPVCSHSARSETTARGLRVICAHCSTAYSIAGR